VKLVSFRVQNYRSINDSGEVSVSAITSLVGRNEAGKSNLLLALQTLNPPDGPVDLSPIKDFPRHRRLSECKDDTSVLSTTWEFTSAEQAHLKSLFPRANGLSRVEISRRYKAPLRYVSFVGLQPLAFLPLDISSKFRKIKPVAEAKIEKLEAAAQAAPSAALLGLASAIAKTQDPTAWATTASPAFAAFRKVLAAASISLPEQEDGVLSELEELAERISKDGPANKAARDWASSLVPTFVYVDEYPELAGHQNIAEYLTRKANPAQLKVADKNFEKICKVADLDPQLLHTLFTANDHETRNQIANRASAIVTSELRRLWKDRQLKVRFSLDANHLDTFISDPNSAYDVEVNLDERSRGLKWFFSFYISFAADTKGGAAQNAILLLDEPGLYLHALSQADLLRHLSTDYKNQILYTTHSPFMVPTSNLDSVRTVSIAQDLGTTVSNDPAGDSRTLFPIQAALGYSMSQSLFVGPNNLVVEGVTDFWMLSSVSSYLQSLGKRGLPEDMTMTPAGGAQKVPYMVALLTSEQLRVIVLFDEEKQSRATRDELVRAKLIKEINVVSVIDAFADNDKPSEADIEDLLDPVIYDALVQESYAKELAGKTIELNMQIPRIVKRYEQAFEAAGMEFHKTRPARLFLKKMADEAAHVLPPASLDRIDRLFTKIRDLHTKNVARSAEAFS